MKRAALLLAAVLLASGSAIAAGGHGGGHGGGGGHGHGGGGHGHGHGWSGGWHHHSDFGATFFYGPWFWDPYFFPYAPAYYPGDIPPPDDADVPPPESGGWSTEGDADNPLDASYGLIRLAGVPDGATVELDGRYWMQAARLSERWLALPRGRHSITTRGPGGATQERRIDVEPGTTAVVQF
jgi:hypothetical protein